MFAANAAAFTSIFRSTAKFLPNREVVRTGQPVRKELREASQKPKTNDAPTVLVIGGSQGSEFLNAAVPKAASLGRFQARVIHLTGRANLDSTKNRVRELGLDDTYELHPYMEAEALREAYRQATVTVARAGGTLAEFAVFRLPSVLVPLPSSANDHQLENAREFEAMEAATLLWQPEDSRKPAPPATPEAVADAIAEWIENEPKRAMASHNLSEWDIPDAAERIVRLIEKAAQKKP